MRARLADRVVLVTGSGSGIGEVIARRVAAEGGRVIVADIDGAAAARVASGIPGASAAELDVTSGPQVRELVATVTAEHGRIDVLVNNAAVCGDTPFLALTEDEWRRDIAVSLDAAFHTTQAVLPSMTATGGGAILNVASVNALSYIGNEAYSAAKAALISLTRSTAVRFGRHGIRCNALAPGTIATPAWQRRVDADPAIFDRLVRWYPLGRLGTPDDVASAVLFLCSDDASWITGVTLQVDGGLLAGLPRMVEDIFGAEPSGDGP